MPRLLLLLLLFLNIDAHALAERKPAFLDRTLASIPSPSLSAKRAQEPGLRFHYNDVPKWNPEQDNPRLQVKRPINFKKHGIFLTIAGSALMGIGIAILTNNDKMPNAKHLGGKPIGRQSGYDILGGGYVLGGTIMVVTGVVYLFR